MATTQHLTEVVPIDSAPSAADGVVHAVLERLLDDYPRYFPGAAARPSVTSVAVASRRLSDIARVHLSLGGAAHDIYVKVHKKPTSPIERVRQKAGLEFEMLCQLFERFRDIPGHAVARPIAFFPDTMAVVTEAVRGENLHRVIKRLARGWPRREALEMLTSYCRAAGSWLRHFQRITDQGRVGPLPVEDIRGQVVAELDICVRMGLSRGEADRLLRFLDTEISRAGSSRLPVVGEHPDFTPDNVLCAPGLVTVIDFTSFRYGTTHSDPARFLAALAFFAKNPLYRRPRITSLTDAFLEGYGWARDRRDPALNVYLVRYVVQAVKTASTWPHPAPLRRLVEWRAARFLSTWSRHVTGMGDCLASAPA